MEHNENMNISALQNLTKCSFVRSVEYHGSIDSTNNRARRLAEGLEPLQGQAAPSPKTLPHWLPCLILAEEQSAGRGRGANRWWTGPGSLALSLLLPPLRTWPRLLQPSPRKQSLGTPWELSEKGPSPANASGPEFLTGLIGLAAALAVLQTVCPRLPGVMLGLCWPNDVFAAGKKLAGILVEVLSTGLVVVGIGVNTNNTAQEAPEELRDRVATLRDLTGQTHPHESLLPELLDHLAERFLTCAVTPNRVASDAHQWCLQRGQFVKIHTSGGIVMGICEGIGPHGELLLATGTGTQRIFSGSMVP